MEPASTVREDPSRFIDNFVTTTRINAERVALIISAIAGQTLWGAFLGGVCLYGSDGKRIQILTFGMCVAFDGYLLLRRAAAKPAAQPTQLILKMCRILVALLSGPLMTIVAALALVTIFQR